MTTEFKTDEGLEPEEFLADALRKLLTSVGQLAVHVPGDEEVHYLVPFGTVLQASIALSQWQRYKQMYAACPCCGQIYGCYCHEHPHDKPECPGRRLEGE